LGSSCSSSHNSLKDGSNGKTTAQDLILDYVTIIGELFIYTNSRLPLRQTIKINVNVRKTQRTTMRGVSGAEEIDILRQDGKVNEKLFTAVFVMATALQGAKREEGKGWRRNHQCNCYREMGLGMKNENRAVSYLPKWICEIK
jgi:hypothetical protein